MKLTDVACRAAKPKSTQYKMADGAGLYLLVKPNGRKYWRMNYNFDGKPKTYAIGVYPFVTLAEAREARDSAKKLIKQGIDPNEAKRDQKRQRVRNAQNTFKATALDWLEAQRPRWTEATYKNVLRRLDVDVFPVIGDRPLTAIKAPDLLDALKKIEKRGALDIAGRVRQICGQVFRYGIQLGRCEHNPAEALRGALQTRKTKHFDAIDTRELPELMQSLRRNDARLYPRTRNAIMLSLLTFLRPGEVRKAQWSHIDLDAGEWIIPAECMKKRRSHFIPLSHQAIAVLREQKEESGRLNTDWVFPHQSRPSKPMSDGTVLRALQNLGFKKRMTAHGFRALARTGIREKLDYQPDVIEAQLAHKAAGPLGEAYNRAQFLDQRKVMMQDWADYIDTVSAGGTVIHANFKKQA